MANVVKFKINGLSSALNNVYTRVTDLSRNELYSGETLVSDASGNVELDIGTAGSDGQGVIVYGDNYSTGNESTFKSFTGYGLIEAEPMSTYSFENLDDNYGEVISLQDSSGLKNITNMSIQNNGSTLNGVRCADVVSGSYVELPDNFNNMFNSDYMIVLVVALDNLTNAHTVLEAIGSNGEVSIIADPMNELLYFKHGSTELTMAVEFDYDVQIISIERFDGSLVGRYNQTAASGLIAGEVDGISSIKIVSGFSGLFAEALVYPFMVSNEIKAEIGVIL